MELVQKQKIVKFKIEKEDLRERVLHIFLRAIRKRINNKKNKKNAKMYCEIEKGGIYFKCRERKEWQHVYVD